MDCKQPIRIAQVIGKMWAGGVEAVVFNYYREIDHSKVQFDFYYDADSTVQPPADIIEMGARFYKLPPYQKLGSYLSELRKSLVENNYTIVHSHLNTLSVFPLFAAWTAGIPIRIAHSHSVPGGNELKKNAVKKILKTFSKMFSTEYFACSEKAGRWLFGDKCFESGKVVIVKNAINFEKFRVNKTKQTELRRKLGLDSRKVFGHVGRFTFAKNHMKLLDVFKEIHDKDSNTSLLLVGDGELHDKIFEKIKELQIDDCVVCVGKVQNPEIYYSAIDTIIIPSYFEGFSMTAIESQVSGVPIVISEAIPDEAVISDSYQYMKLEDSDKAWADAAYGLLGKTVKLNEKSDDFDIRKCAPKLQNWYLSRDNG